MTLNNLKLALQLNNAKINQEINLLIAYVNQFATNQKDLHYEINNKFQSLDNDIDQLNSDMTYQISLLDTKFTNRINNLADDYGLHKNNTDIHITAEEREKWNNTTQYTDGTVKDHAENLTIHVTQADKDLWNAALDNAKAYAKSLFDQLTSFEIVKCTELPTEDIKTMTIYFLQIDPEQDDLYEEYMYIDGQWEKIGNTRIDLSDYVTKAMLQSEVDTLNNTITTKETAINKSISDLEAKHDQDVQDLQKDISDLSDTVTQLDTDINKTITDKAKELQDNINTLKNKHDQDVQNINNNINQLEQDIDNINAGISNFHTHSNKSVLDNLTQSVIDNSHTHTNKSVLDNVTQQIIDDSHKHTNKSALDNLTQTVIDNSHKHDNKNVLDKLSADADGNLLYNGEALKSGDVTTQDLNNALANYAQKSALDNYATTEVLNDYAKKTDLNQYAKSTDIANTYATKTALDDYLKKTSLSDYAKKSDLSEYAKSTDLHTHENKDTIDKFSTDKEGNLLFNGSKIRGDITKQEVDNLLQGYVKQNEYRVSADEGNIISKHDDGLYASIDDSIAFSDDYSDKKVAKGKFFGQDYYETTFAITLDNTNPFKFSHGIERIADVIEIKGYIKDDTKYYPLNFNNSQRFFTGYADENYIYIDRRIFSDIDESEQDTLWLTGKTAYITIRYTLKPYQSNFITKDNRVIITKEGNVFWSLNEDKTNLITK